MRKMKGFGALFTMVGTVIGAGFVSGRELLQFFGCCRLLRRRESRRAAAPCKESLYSYARSHYAGGNKRRA